MSAQSTHRDTHARRHAGTQAHAYAHTHARTHTHTHTRTRTHRRLQCSKGQTPHGRIQGADGPWRRASRAAAGTFAAPHRAPPAPAVQPILLSVVRSARYAETARDAVYAALSHSTPPDKPRPLPFAALTCSCLYAVVCQIGLVMVCQVRYCHPLPPSIYSCFGRAWRHRPATRLLAWRHQPATRLSTAAADFFIAKAWPSPLCSGFSRAAALNTEPKP